MANKKKDKSIYDNIYEGLRLNSAWASDVTNAGDKNKAIQTIVGYLDPVTKRKPVSFEQLLDMPEEIRGKFGVDEARRIMMNKYLEEGVNNSLVKRQFGGNTMGKKKNFNQKKSIEGFPAGPIPGSGFHFNINPEQELAGKKRYEKWLSTVPKGKTPDEWAYKQYGKDVFGRKIKANQIDMWLIRGADFLQGNIPANRLSESMSIPKGDTEFYNSLTNDQILDYMSNSSKLNKDTSSFGFQHMFKPSSHSMIRSTNQHLLRSIIDDNRGYGTEENPIGPPEYKEKGLGGTIGAGVGTIVGGPVGAAIGGTAGFLIDSLFNREEEPISRKQNPYIDYNLDPSALPSENIIPMEGGGSLTEFNGPKHSYGGIKLPGVGVEVEGGESRTGDTIHSDSIYVTKELIAQFPDVDLKKSDIGKSISDAIKLRDKKFDKYPGDKWNEQSRKAMHEPFNEMSDYLGKLYDGQAEQGILQGEYDGGYNNESLKMGGNMKKMIGAGEIPDTKQFSFGQYDNKFDYAGLAPMASQGLTTMFNMARKPEEVDYRGVTSGRVGRVRPRMIDSSSQIEDTRGTFRGGLRDLMARDPRGARRVGIQALTEESKAISGIRERTQNINQMARSRADEVNQRGEMFNVQNRMRGDMFNAQLDMREQDANAANRAMRQSVIDAGINQMGAMAGQRGADVKAYDMQNRNIDMNNYLQQQYFDLLGNMGNSGMPPMRVPPSYSNLRDTSLDNQGTELILNPGPDNYKWDLAELYP